MKFDECGVRFGWAGNQAVVYADTKVLTTREDYDAFLEKLSALPVPEFLKDTKEGIAETGTDHESVITIEHPTEDNPENTDSESAEVNEKKGRSSIFSMVSTKHVQQVRMLSVKLEHGLHQSLKAGVIARDQRG